MTDYAIELAVRSYIAHPYWPEVEDVVNIEKKSGMNMARTADKRTAKLLSYLEASGMTRADYDRLVQLAGRAWYRVDDLDQKSEIVIPRHHLSAALVQACSDAPSGARIKVDVLRSVVTVLEPLRTGRHEASGVFRRFVRPTDAKTGRPLSNQRALRENQHLLDFTAVGTIGIDTKEVKWEQVKALLEYAGKVGIGASRKMGYGRFEVSKFEAA